MRDILELTRTGEAEDHMGHMEIAELIVDGLPTDPYERYRQPHYPDRDVHIAVLAELRAHGPVADPRETDVLQDSLTEIALNPSLAATDLSGRCAQWLIRLSPTNIAAIVAEQEARREIVAEELGILTVDMARILFQDVKPRTSMLQKTAAGNVTAYFGDGYNGYKLRDRTPDPRRMLRSYDQAAILDSAVRSVTGRPLISAHEGLNLGLELAMLHRDLESGSVYNGTGNVVWIGDRTNDPDGPFVAALEGVANPIGIKLGPSATPEKIRAIHDRLNPDDKPGKILYMIRVGDDIAAINGIARALPLQQIYMYDSHKSTIDGGDGFKIRAVSRLASDAILLARGLERHGLPLHGLHLEVDMDPARQEAVDAPDQLPRDKSIVDPGLSPAQYRNVLRMVAPYMPGAKVAA